VGFNSAFKKLKTTSDHFRPLQTTSDHFRPLQITSDLFRPLQTNSYNKITLTVIPFPFVLLQQILEDIIKEEFKFNIFNS
jgi:hypothetical protein